MQKLCKDCKWYGTKVLDSTKCTNPKILQRARGKPLISLVDGGLFYKYYAFGMITCEYQRHDSLLESLFSRTCGKRGKYWEKGD